MKLSKGFPDASGEYIVAMRTNAGIVIEVANYGRVEGRSDKVFYVVEDGEVEALDNVVGWAYEPDAE